MVPELMTEELDDIDVANKTVLAIGPGLGMRRKLVARLWTESNVPTVIDADGLNCLAKEDGTETDFHGHGVQTILTPHPGEMARLLGQPVTDRLNTTRNFAMNHDVCVVLKGYRTLIAVPDGAKATVWINPTGSPAMSKGGTGDILTGLIAGLVAQWPNEIGLAVRAAVWLHGRAGELAAEALTEQCVLATDLLAFLPQAIRECR
jgi:NAD(P)H-hydrate epimerase